MSGKKVQTTYDKLSNAVKLAYSSEISNKKVQEKTNELWNQIKLAHKVAGIERDKATDQEIEKLVELARRKKTRATIFFAQVSKKSVS